jgi:hypothetical protein
MQTVTYQTIKLTRGKHQSPDHGACVMELASMLAGEPFSDHPASVCPIIGSFLRAYNDSIDDVRRQDLYDYASKVVGSRASAEVRRARAQRLIAWGLHVQQRRWTRLVPRFLRALAWQPELDVIGPQVVRAIANHDDRTHAEALALIDDLLATGGGDRHAQDEGQRRPSTPAVTSAITEPRNAPASTSPG